MVDQSAVAYARLHHRRLKMRLNKQQSLMFQTRLARSYTDDADVGRTAVCPPAQYNRPGQRDDEIHCTFVGVIPIK
jgi:hypothetical protein